MRGAADWPFLPHQQGRRLEDFRNHNFVQTEHPLRNNGDRRLGDATVIQARQDYFLRSPVLQQILREELEKLHTLQEVLQWLEAIGKALSRYGSDLNDFFDMLFYGMLDCTDSMGSPAYNTKTCRILFHYIDSEGLPSCYLQTQEDAPDLPHSRSFPFYQAFLSYRALPEESPVRQEMQLLLQQRPSLRKAPPSSSISKKPGTLSPSK